MKPSLVLVFVLVLTVVTASGQTPAPTQGTPAPAAPEGQPPAAAPRTPSSTEGFSYNPEGRRDPFVSLLRRAADTDRRPAGARPPGLAGLETSEVTLKGTVAGRAGYVAIVQGSDSKTYIVREGERLLDGAVRTITQNAMVIVQQVNDPLSLVKQREVRKVLRQSEEAKQ